MKFRFSGNLLRYVDFHREIEVDGRTVEQGVNNVIDLYPEFGEVILDGDGQIRLLHRFCVNGEYLTQAELKDPVESDIVVSIVSPITGG